MKKPLKMNQIRLTYGYLPDPMVSFRVVQALVAPLPKAKSKAKVQFGSPPGNNPPRLGFGSYCIRAHADVFDQGHVVGFMEGYDSSLDIIKEVEGRCRADMRHRGLECGATSVVILTNVDGMMCEGMYFEFEGRRVRLL